MSKAFLRAAWRVTPFKPQAKRLIYSRWNPRYWRQFGRACAILGFRFGLLNSMVRNAAVTSSGEPIPWYTYPAIEFLNQFDFTSAAILEYGCGNSTLYWAGRAKSVVSIEHERGWYDHMRSVAPGNVELIYAANAHDYASAAGRSSDGRYDIIVIDGQSRLLCAEQALRRLTDEGFIILDNSDWFPQTAKVLRSAGLLQVDFFGFAPINDYTSSTSLFFQRDCVLRPRRERQPVTGIGGLSKDFDEAWWA